MGVQNHVSREKRSPSHICQPSYSNGDTDKICQSMTSHPVDAAIAEAFLEAVSPLGVEVGFRVLEQLEQDVAAQRRQRELRLEQARYEARLAQRQYDAVDPDHCLVASELERRWNEKLERVNHLEQAYAQAEQEVQWNITPQERQAIKELSQNLPLVWGAETTTNRERKRLLRMAIESVQLDGVGKTGEIEVQIRWRSGMLTSNSSRPLPGSGQKGWGRDSPTVAGHGAAKIDQRASSLHAAGLRDGEQPRRGYLSQSTAIAKAGLAPLHGYAQGALGGVVGRLHAGILKKCEQAVAMLKQCGGEIAHRAILAIQMPLGQREPILLQPKRTLH